LRFKENILLKLNIVSSKIDSKNRIYNYFKTTIAALESLSFIFCHIFYNITKCNGQENWLYKIDLN